MRMNRNGVSIIEVAIVIGILGIIATAVNSYFLYQQVGALKQEKQSLVQDVIMMNVAEINGKPVSSYPEAGNCLYRYYTVGGDFLREGTAIKTEHECAETYSSTRGEIKIVVEVDTNTTGTTTFVPNKFLKLPEAASTNLREFRVSGAYYPPRGMAPPPLTLTILRKK